MKKSTWVVHAIFECKDCDKRWEGYKNAQAVGAKHAKHHKHLVHGEVGLAVDYDGRE